MAQYLEPRVDISLDVKVWGMDLYGKPFVQHARTVNATSVGARLIGIDCVREGEVISLQHENQKARCKVVWVGRDAAKSRQIGIQVVEPDKKLFGAKLKAPAVQKVQSPSGFTGFAGAAQAAQQARRSMAEPTGTRRAQQRFHCTGGIEMRRNEGAPPVFGNLSDLSLTGCYVETVSTLPVGSEILFMLRVRDNVVRGRAQVKTSHHAVGLGLVFAQLSREDQAKLEYVLSLLSGSLDLNTDDPGKLAPEDPLPTFRPPSINTVQPISRGGSSKMSSQMSTQVTRTIEELNQVEQGLVIDKVDPRIIAQFHDAVEHLRQTAWSVVQWVELNSSGGDPFEVLPQLEAERMHMLRKLAHNVTADLDSGSVTRFTEGISSIYEEVQALYRGLRKIVIDGPEDK
ncbi:MAG TPA: PilZ domain-containing protein [Candidatus Binatia bacterium]|nr:PilZ domain-containing protein [Candidatus Binatia bacterium]